MELNELPWSIADDMDDVKRKLETAWRQIRELKRPVPPMAIVRAKSMRDLLDRIINLKHGEHNENK